MIKVLIADDQTLVRQGFRSLLGFSDAVEVVAEAGDGEQVLHALGEHAVDVLLLDLQMPRLTGLQVLERIHQQRLGVSVIVLTTFDDDAKLLECARLGARGYLLKDVSLEQLSSAIIRVAAGELLIEPLVTRRVIHGLQRQAQDFEHVVNPEALTQRELDVLRYMAGGYSNREIASAIHLTEGTVKNHVSSILSKFGVRDRTRAVLKAMEMGLIGGG
ncbi:response regulator [Halopseudomonas salina]|uniref:DNA-binding response regulator n=1 Tax=Halopseudomonas salina TaxID=1323744 RepID=A0ABQ1PSF1_9GAMM|nr:response regulator transcription factor [Halopseudomonas salina]GGD02285.1 DNA-binding response regulator [Halopseudomonas salina]